MTALLAVAGCDIFGSVEGEKNPGLQVIRTAPFDLTNDPQPFLDAGCVVKTQGGTDALTWARLDCSSAQGVLADIVIQPGLVSVPSSLGGLEPNLSMGSTTASRGRGIVTVGCRSRQGLIYVVHDVAGFTRLDTKEAFVERFAPVESPGEALSFASALNNAWPDYELDLPGNFELLQSTIEATNVKQTPEGYVVRLFDRKRCGCGDHETSAVDFLVTRQGEVVRQSSVPVYIDPRLKGKCID